MRSQRTWLRGSVGLVGVLFCCWGCAAPSPAGKVATGESPGITQEEAAATGAASEEGSSKVATTLLGVQVQGTPDETVVVLTGNGTFRDYQFSRVGDRRFALELADIKDAKAVPALPILPDHVELRYGEAYGQEGRGVELVGGLKRPLDNYVVNTVGNTLTLTLYSASGMAPIAAADRGEALPPAKVNRGTPAERSVESTSSRGGERTVRASNPKRKGSEESDGEASQGLKKKYMGKPISLDLLDADLRNVLRLISEVTGTNIVIEPDVSGRVTLKVEQVPWDQVLDMVLAMNNLGMEQRGGVIRIAKTTKLKDEMNQRYEEIKARQDLMEAAKDVGEITTEYLTVNYAPPAEMANRINEIKSDKGKLSIDERTNLVIYTDYPSRIANAKQIIKRLDKPIPQVMIEARIVTMDDDVSRALGIRWNLNLNNSGPFNNDWAVNWISNAGTAFGWNLGQVIGSTMMNLDLNIAALESTNRSKVLAAPKVLTINNVKAIISQGNQIPYLQQSAADGGVVSTVFKDAIVELQVTPHITPDGKVRMEIEAKQDEQNPTITGGGEGPAIATRKIKTELLVADGCIVVIGGVMRDTQGKTVNTTPGLGNIPILGRLFKAENQTRTRQELLIFISPKIVES